MKKKKTVTLPRTYNPGKGHPKETLAYLNPAEHALIKQLTDGKANRGPMGVRSYAVETGTTTNSTSGGGSTTGGGGSKGPNGGPGGGSLQAPNRTAPSAGAAPASGSTQTKTTSTTNVDNGIVGAKTPATASQSVTDKTKTATGQVAQAAARTASSVSNPVSMSGALDNGYYHSFTKDLPGMNNPTQFDKTIRPTGMVNSAHVPMDTFTKGYNPNSLTPGAQNIHQAVVDNALRTNTPVDFFSGKTGRASGTKQHPMGQALDVRLRDPMTGAFVGADRIGSFASNPIGNVNYGMGRTPQVSKAIQGAIEGPYREFATGVMNSFMDNPGVYGDFENQRWGGSFGGRFGKDYMHYDEGKVSSGVSADQASLRKEAANYRGPGAPSGILSGGTQVAALGNVGMGPAAALDRAKTASAAAAQVAQSFGAPQGPNLPPQGIPTPNSLGIMPSGPSFTPDPRVGLPQGGFPASTPRSAAGTYTSPYDVAQAPTAPKNPIGGMSFTPDLPARMPQSSSVVTDPRVSLTPLGSLPAAKPQQVSWNVPPMGGAMSASPEAWKAFGTWGINHDSTYPKPSPASPGVSGSQTAAVEDAPTTGSWFGNLAKNAGLDPENIVKVATDKVQQIKEGNKKIAALQQSPLGNLMLSMITGGGRGGNLGGSLGNPQENSDWYLKPPAPPQAPNQQTASAAPQAMDAMATLQQLQANMIAQGASPEDLAYIQSIIDELTNSQVA